MAPRKGCWNLCPRFMAVPGSGWPGPNAETNTQRAFVILLGFIHIFLIAVVIGSVEGFMSHLNHNAEQLRLRIMHLNRCVGYAGDGESTGEGLGVGLGGGGKLAKANCSKSTHSALCSFMVQRRLPRDLQERIRKVCAVGGGGRKWPWEWN